MICCCFFRYSINSPKTKESHFLSACVKEWKGILKQNMSADSNKIYNTNLGGSVHSLDAIFTRDWLVGPVSQYQEHLTEIS